MLKASLFIKSILLAIIFNANSYALNHRHLQIVTEHLPPFQIDNNGKVSGFATEIVETALEQTQLDFAITSYPWTRAYNMAPKMDNTCIYSIARTPEREKLFQWIHAIATTNSTFIGLKKSNIVLNTIEDAKKYRIAVLRDDATHQALINKGFEEGKNLFIVNNTYSLLKLLVQRNTIDLILADTVTVKFRAQYDNIDPAIFKPLLHLNKKPFNFYFACSQSTPTTVVDKIKRAFIHIKDSGQQHAITQHWQQL